MTSPLDPDSPYTLTATPESCYWGYLDAAQPPVMTVESGTELWLEAVTHHAGDAPDLLMDDGITAIWEAIAPADRAPGVHIMTGPIDIAGAMPGDTLRVELLEMRPRLPFGSNCAANWGLFHARFGKERITIYELDDAAEGTFPATARPAFGFDFKALALYDSPGVISLPDHDARTPFGRQVSVPVRPHLGVIGVAPPGSERLSSIPPGRFGGNVDNWRFGPGSTIYYPVFHEGAGFYVGDPHFAQGDGEICGTAIEASLDVRLRLSLASDVTTDAPLLRTDTQWFTHGFGAGLDEAMAMAAESMLQLLVDRGGFSLDEAYSLASVAIDLGVTQVVDGVVGCHAAVSHELLTP
jgi:acetamidase/formamidase